MEGDTGVVLAAAGSGRRFGGKKQLAELLGRPLIWYSLEAFARVESVSAIALVVPAEDLETGREILLGWEEERRRGAGAEARALEAAVVPGGRRRQDSVLEGLRALRGRVELAAVHDAARPLVLPEEISAAVEAARRAGAAAVGTPVTDSVKRVRDGRIAEGLPREEVWAVQTPQVAVLERLIEAYERAPEKEFTDEASALEAAGSAVLVVEGSPENLKVTRPSDLAAAERILRARGAGRLAPGARAAWIPCGGAVSSLGMFRTGLGYDNHRLAPGRRLFVGGVEIPSPVGAEAHSDGDVLLHALSDGIYGALGCGDLGEHFPDTDPRYAGARSTAFLEHALRLARERGYRVANVDATVFLEKIRLSPHKAGIRESLRHELRRFWDVPDDAVSVKAKTAEGCDAVGRGEAIAAQVIVLLEREAPPPGPHAERG